MQADGSQAAAARQPHSLCPPHTQEGLWPGCWEIPGIQGSIELGSCGFKKLLHPSPHLDNGNSAGTWPWENNNLHVLRGSPKRPGLEVNQWNSNSLSLGHGESINGPSHTPVGPRLIKGLGWGYDIGSVQAMRSSGSVCECESPGEVGWGTDFSQHLGHIPK